MGIRLGAILKQSDNTVDRFRIARVARFVNFFPTLVINITALQNWELFSANKLKTCF